MPEDYLSLKQHSRCWLSGAAATTLTVFFCALHSTKETLAATASASARGSSPCTIRLPGSLAQFSRSAHPDLSLLQNFSPCSAQYTTGEEQFSSGSEMQRSDPPITWPRSTYCRPRFYISMTGVWDINLNFHNSLTGGHCQLILQHTENSNVHPTYQAPQSSHI